jgi:hypothetical protein
MRECGVYMGLRGIIYAAGERDRGTGEESVERKTLATIVKTTRLHSTLQTHSTAQ